MLPQHGHCFCGWTGTHYTITHPPSGQLLLSKSFSFVSHPIRLTSLSLWMWVLLGQCLDEKCQQYMANNPGKVVTRFQFSDLFSRAWGKPMIPYNICAAFKAAGVYPLDSTAFIACTAASDVTDSPVCHSNCLQT